MKWNYAQLSKAAKLAGGPEKYVASLVAKSKALGVALGRSQMYPWIWVAAAGGGLLGWGISKLTEGRRKAKELDVQDAAAQLVEEIKAYDASYPEEDASAPAINDDQSISPSDPIDPTYPSDESEV